MIDSGLQRTGCACEDVAEGPMGCCIMLFVAFPASFETTVIDGLR